MVGACAAADARLVLTSSMAAVRGGGQLPLSGSYYTADDWNTVSARDGPGFAPYQYSKAASERRAWELAREVGLELVTLCPPMIFGPPRDATCSSFSVELVRKWLRGEKPVASLLVSDVRDVAAAHIEAACRPKASGRRLIVSNERRIPASACAKAITDRMSDHRDTRRGARGRGGRRRLRVCAGDGHRRA